MEEVVLVTRRGIPLMGDKIKHLYRGTSYELIANEFWVEAETYDEAKEKVDAEEAEFGRAELVNSFIQLDSIEVIEEDE